ncbi:hypothetical protein C5167_007447 [Papaver somniferum]|nr:hypothetical protein C5167_007447 [Papaver somniferum]
MALGSLEDHLDDFPPDRKRLDWSTRLKITAGDLNTLVETAQENGRNPPIDDDVIVKTHMNKSSRKASRPT